jgi:hypothetical protein
VKPKISNKKPAMTTHPSSKSRNSQMQYSSYSKQASVVKSHRQPKKLLRKNGSATGQLWVNNSSFLSKETIGEKFSSYRRNVTKNRRILKHRFGSKNKEVSG